jgi:hypothetical protein
MTCGAAESCGATTEGAKDGLPCCSTGYREVVLGAGGNPNPGGIVCGRTVDVTGKDGVGTTPG